MDVTVSGYCLLHRLQWLLIVMYRVSIKARAAGCSSELRHVRRGCSLMSSAEQSSVAVIAIVIVIVIVNSKPLKRHSKAKRRAPAYSRAMRQIREVFQ